MEDSHVLLYLEIAMNTHGHLQLLIFTFLPMMWSQVSGNEIQMHFASSMAEEGSFDTFANY